MGGLLTVGTNQHATEALKQVFAIGGNRIIGGG